jgi:hypothetical protein
LELARTGLPGLDGFAKAVGDKAIIVPYKFKDDVRMRIARNRRALREFLDLNDELQKAIMADIMGDANAVCIPEGQDEKQGRFAQRYNASLKDKHDVELYTFKREELFVEDKNPIPGSVEDALAPIIEGAIETPAPVAAPVEPAKTEETPGGDS